MDIYQFIIIQFSVIKRSSMVIRQSSGSHQCHQKVSFVSVVIKTKIFLVFFVLLLSKWYQTVQRCVLVLEHPISKASFAFVVSLSLTQWSILLFSVSNNSSSQDFFENKIPFFHTVSYKIPSKMISNYYFLISLFCLQLKK